MNLTRRQFLLSSVASFGTTLFPMLGGLYAASSDATNTKAAYPSFSVLNRITYGSTPANLEHFNKIGLKQYLEEQLNPVDFDDQSCNERLSKATLHIEYKENKDYKALSEDRPLNSLNKPAEELWKLADNSNKMDYKERVRPAQEVRTATWIRAVYSKWQLHEIMVEFWHNHFNVHAFSNQNIGATFPLYDTIMRKHCFGNFRALLEDVSQSSAMLFYLNNAKSVASPANENYARELFELHTLGADHYYNNLYNRWREVPGAVEGHPIGYIDQDVYEAARAFTGWTIEDGANTGKGTIFPKTGKFTYFDGWHDNYQKRVLGVEFDPNSPPMADGKKVLDLVAAHPGTAIHLCTKICRRLVSDNPPESLIKNAVQIWTSTAGQPDQIKSTVRAIILSPEFIEMQGQKMKRPLEYVISFLRATDADVTPNENLFYAITGAGYKQFEWVTPTGHPDVAQYWLNTNTMLSNWNTLENLFAGWFKAASFSLASKTPSYIKTSQQIVEYWYERLVGTAPSKETTDILMNFMPYELEPDHLPDIHSKDFEDRLNNVVTLIGMLPHFHLR